MKNRLKSLFIGMFPLFGLIITVVAAYQFYVQGWDLSWLGTLICGATIAVFFASVFIVDTPRTSPNLTLQMVVISLGFGLSLVAGFLNSFVVFQAALLSGIAWIGWLVYEYWYSRFDDRSHNQILKVGNKLPNFELKDIDGSDVSLTDFKGSFGLYLFYRGNWCPLCMAQIKEIAQQYQELNDRGVKIALISPQPHTHTQNLSKRFEVPFHFWRDEAGQVAKLLNIFAPSGTPTGLEVLGYASDTVLPTVIITNPESEIIFVDLTDNYRVRPEPETFLAVLDQVKG